MQERYWKYLREKRIYIYYLDEDAERSYKCDKAVKIYCAVASSASIAGWAIWGQYSFAWAAMIAVSHVITAIYEFLPYSKRLKYLAPFIKELKLLGNRIEYNWFGIASGKLTEEEINDLLYHLEAEFIEMENKYLKKELSLSSKKFMEKAVEKTDIYLERFYHTENDETKQEESI